MSTQAHTPGPWQAHDLHDNATKGFIAVITTAKPSGHIADIFPFGGRHGGGDRPLEEHKANARLIAAAPALYEAIRNSDDAHWTPAMRAAMAQAEGIQ